jgi:excisionase family DNA binding protein
MEYLTITEAAEATGIEPATLRGMCRDGVLEAYEEGGRWAIPEEAVDALVEQVEAVEATVESGENEPEDDSDDGEDDE